MKFKKPKNSTHNKDTNVVVGSGQKDRFRVKFSKKQKITSTMIVLILVLVSFMFFYTGSKQKSEDKFVARYNEAKAALDSKDYQLARDKSLEAANFASDSQKLLAAYDITVESNGLLLDYENNVELIKTALEKTDVSDQNYPIFVSMLAGAYVGVRDFDNAIKEQERLVGLYEESNYKMPYSRELAVATLENYKQLKKENKNYVPLIPAEKQEVNENE